MFLPSFIYIFIFQFLLYHLYIYPQKCQETRNIDLLDKINNIDEDCLEDDLKVSYIYKDSAENNCDLFDSDTDEKNKIYEF